MIFNGPDSDVIVNAIFMQMNSKIYTANFNNESLFWMAPWAA